MTLKIFFNTFLMIVTLLMNEVAIADLTTGLIGYYPFNGNVDDKSGAGHDGVAYGTTLTTDKFGKTSAYNFNGVDNYIELGSWFNNQTFTVSMWLKPGSTQLQYADIIDNNHTDYRSWVLQQDSTTTNTYLWGGHDNDGTTGATYFSLNPNEWTHVTLTRDGVSKVKTVYINGSSLPSVTGTFDIVYDGTEFLSFGRYANGSLGRYWNGIMDEVRIYNRALSPAEVQELYDMMADVGGCLIYRGKPSMNKQVILKQRLEADKITYTDNAGCYNFDDIVRNKSFKVVIQGPYVK